MKINELKGRIVAKGYTQAQIAREIGLSPKTFSLRLKNGVFGSDEIVKMIELLDIENPADIFLSKK